MAAATVSRPAHLFITQAKADVSGPEPRASLSHQIIVTSRRLRSEGSPKQLLQLLHLPHCITTIAWPQCRGAHLKVCAVTGVEERVRETDNMLATKPLIKVCGVTCPEDAAVAATAGADLIGMIMWPGSKRYVTLEQAAQISAAARQHGAEPVAVFVDGTAADIVDACAAADISIAQLHGDEARAALRELPPQLKIVYVLHAEADGTIRTPLPVTLDADKRMGMGKDPRLVQARVPIESRAAILEPDAVDNSRSEKDSVHASEIEGEVGRCAETVNDRNQRSESQDPGLMSREGATVDWLLVDGVSAGSGETYEWTNLRLPQGLSRRGWLLAGGLDPTNVGAALGAAQPDGVDVASGVAGLDKIRKDKARVEAFIQAVKSAPIAT